MPESYWDHIATAFDTVSLYDGAHVFATDLKKYPSYVGDLLAAHWFLSEMSNGGIAQFFANPTAVVAEDAVRAFINLGLPQVADAVRKSVTKAGCSDIPAPEMFEEEERQIYTVAEMILVVFTTVWIRMQKKRQANQ